MRRSGRTRWALSASVMVLLSVWASVPVRATTADGTVVGATKILDCGSSSTHLNLVLIAEGFRSSELAAFEAAAQSFQDTLLRTPPFDEGFAINVWRVDVTSTDSGADTYPSGCAGAASLVRTYFDASFCTLGLDRLLAVNDATVIDVVNAQVPEWDAIVVIVNTAVFGGSGGQLAVMALVPGWEGTALHELGHSLFGLADEYEYLAGCLVGESGHDRFPAFEPSPPNVTIETDRTRVKWGDLISATTPLPSSHNANCALCDPQPNPLPDGTVGLFEGANYYHCDVYRAEWNCRMRSAAVPFCAVCRRRIREVLAQFAAPPRLCGDADGNGALSVTDGVIVLRSAAGLATTCSASCDVDGSGSVTVTDGVNVLRRAAGLTGAAACPAGECSANDHDP